MYTISGYEPGVSRLLEMTICQVLEFRLDLGHMRSIELELRTSSIIGVYIAKLDSSA